MQKGLYVCEQCKDTGWADVRRADGSYVKVLCYCHPLVKAGKIKPLSGSTELAKYIQYNCHKGRRKHVQEQESPRG